jgi:hypothetical protein
MYGVVLTQSHLHRDDVLGAWFVCFDETPGPRGTVVLPCFLLHSCLLQEKLTSALGACFVTKVAGAAFSFLGSYTCIRSVDRRDTTLLPLDCVGLDGWLPPLQRCSREKPLFSHSFVFEH